MSDVFFAEQPPWLFALRWLLNSPDVFEHDSVTAQVCWVVRMTFWTLVSYLLYAKFSGPPRLDWSNADQKSKRRHRRESRRLAPYSGSEGLPIYHQWIETKARVHQMFRQLFRKDAPSTISRSRLLAMRRFADPVVLLPSAQVLSPEVEEKSTFSTTQTTKEKEIQWAEGRPLSASLRAKIVQSNAVKVDNSGEDGGRSYACTDKDSGRGNRSVLDSAYWKAYVLQKLEGNWSDETGHVAHVRRASMTLAFDSDVTLPLSFNPDGLLTFTLDDNLWEGQVKLGKSGSIQIVWNTGEVWTSEDAKSKGEMDAIGNDEKDNSHVKFTDTSEQQSELDGTVGITSNQSLTGTPHDPLLCSKDSGCKSSRHVALEDDPESLQECVQWENTLGLSDVQQSFATSEETRAEKRTETCGTEVDHAFPDHSLPAALIRSLPRPHHSGPVTSRQKQDVKSSVRMAIPRMAPSQAPVVVPPRRPVVVPPRPFPHDMLAGMEVQGMEVECTSGSTTVLSENLPRSEDSGLKNSRYVALEEDPESVLEGLQWESTIGLTYFGVTG